MNATNTRILAIARKEFIHLARDWRTLVAVLVLPGVQLLLFAYAISYDVRNVPTVIVDQDLTPASRAYIAKYEASGLYDVRGRVANVEAVRKSFERGEARIAVVVPPGFARSLARGDKAQVAVLVDGSEPNSALIGSTFSRALNEGYGQRIQAEWADARGLDLERFGRIEPRIRMWYNPERRSADFLIPGLLVVIIMIVTTQQSAVTLVRERDQGTEEQMRVSPLRRSELMVGKLLPWTLLAFADMVAIVALSTAVFDVPLRGDVSFLAASILVFVFCSLGIGLIISAVAPSMESANIAALMISFLPGFMLSGFAFPLDSIPTVLQWASYLFPGRYMMAISRGVFLKGAGFAELSDQLGCLVVYAVAAITLSSVVSARRQR